MILHYYWPLRKLGLGKTTVWGIALRKTSNYDTILKKSESKIPFDIINNTNEYWFADPLLFSDGYKTWLFVEAFSYERHKGEIGVFEIKDGKAVNFQRVIETSTHMSYPFVFEYQNEYYMIPETGAAKEIVLYKAESFPYSWKREKVLLTGEVYRDSTVFKDEEGNLKVLSYKQIGTNRFNVRYYLTTFNLDMNKMELVLQNQEVDKHQKNRPAGPFFKSDGSFYRVSQKCDRAYGESIYVYSTDISTNNQFINDNIVNELRGDNILLKTKSKPILLHTYSQAGGYEVIDFKCTI